MPTVLTRCVTSPVVLSLAGVELIFFRAAHTVLCFGFVAEPVLLLLLSSTSTVTRLALFIASSMLGGTRSQEGTQRGQLAPGDQRDIPCDITSCSALKQRGQVLGTWPLLRRWQGICLLVGGLSEWLPLHHFWFFLPLSSTYFTIFILTHTFFHFSPSYSLSGPAGSVGEWASSCLLWAGVSPPHLHILSCLLCLSDRIPSEEENMALHIQAIKLFTHKYKYIHDLTM